MHCFSKPTNTGFALDCWKCGFFSFKNCHYFRIMCFDRTLGHFPYSSQFFSTSLLIQNHVLFLFLRNKTKIKTNKQKRKKRKKHTSKHIHHTQTHTKKQTKTKTKKTWSPLWSNSPFKAGGLSWCTSFCHPPLTTILGTKHNSSWCTSFCHPKTSLTKS